MRVHVFIATTQGPVAIQRVTEEEADVQSVVCVDGGMEPLAISARYHDFVKKGTGLLQRDFGGPAYRLDVSGRIDQGNSWQLPVYLAHYLSAQGILGDGIVQAGDKALWATGALKADKRILSVEEIPTKLSNSIELLHSLSDVGVLVLVPKEDQHLLALWLQEHSDLEINRDSISFHGVDQLPQAKKRLEEFVFPGEPETEPGNVKREPPYHSAFDGSVNMPVDQGNDIPMDATLDKKAPLRHVKKAMLIAVLLGLGLLGYGYSSHMAGLINPASQAVLVVELGQFAGDCNSEYIVERELKAQRFVFESVDLNRLCSLSVEVGDDVQTVMGVALDNGAILPIVYRDEHWQISLPTQRNRSRDYALLVLASVSAQQAEPVLKKELSALSARQQGVSTDALAIILQQQQWDADVYRHQLRYLKKSANVF
jgi:hypothetical protein